MKFSSEHFLDSGGNPAGGTTYGVGFCIGWQHGPLGRGSDRREPNGAFVETIIEAAIDRVEFYQSTRFNCAENEMILTRLKDALEACRLRTRNREQRGVEGVNEV